ncbi:MAG TPA: hypothetical protein VK489_11455 [Ferruginibacter sp.]|nr:hypothetical protein [Ferruginibacter sp.]
MKFQFLIIALFSLTMANAQNVGIGTATPGFPLNFANTAGDKISLFGNTGNHYGFGIQSGLLQVHSDIAGSNIAFGYGSSASFTERMRIINNTGFDGMSLNGRLILRNGSTDLVNGGAGVWLYKADNSGQLGFMGTQNNQNIGFYGGSAGWGFTYNAINSHVGIGNNNPNAPLAFAASLGKKITLYPGATGDVGFGVAGNRLQIYSDNPNADVAIGYDAGGTFNERFAVKPNGALAINGNTGTATKVLTSNGVAPATWSSPTNDLYNKTVKVSGTNGVPITNYTFTDVPGYSYSFAVNGNAKVSINFSVFVIASSCAFCAKSEIDLSFNLDGTDVSLQRFDVPNSHYQTLSGSIMLEVGPGSHLLKLRAAIGGPATVYVGSGGNWYQQYSNGMIIQVIQQ